MTDSERLAILPEFRPCCQSCSFVNCYWLARH